MKQKLQLKGTYIAIAWIYFSAIFLSKEWYSGVVSQLLEKNEFWLTTAGYLCAYEKWKETKPFGRKLGWNELSKLFPEEKWLYSTRVKNIIKNNLKI